jgi:23S rRNA pseudouridine1911/1915/1917 synthase
VDRAPAEKSLLDWLLSRYPDTPKTRARQWIEAGRVSVDGVVRRKANDLLSDPGETLELLGREAVSLDCGSGWQIHPRLELMFLDSALAVLNKGAGLISVPGPDTQISGLSILADVLAGKLRPRGRGPSGGTLPATYRHLRPLPVHRLDQYTTGLFCVALNPEARANLINQVRVHSMQRVYLAYVEGRPRQAKGTWRHWLELSEDQLQQRVVGPKSRADAQEAVTHYQVLAEYSGLEGSSVVTKLRLQLETGLRHQIRIQAAQEGLPLIGDRTYNPNYRDIHHQRGPVPFSRQALHSEVLTLEHPNRSGQIMSWRADLPKDLRELESASRSRRI